MAKIIYLTLLISQTLAANDAFKVMSTGVFSKTYYCEAGHSRSKYDAIENCNKLKDCDSNYRSCMIDLSGCNEESLSLQARVENQEKDLDDCNERRDYYKSVVDSWKRSVSSYKSAYKEYFHKHNQCQRQLELKKNSADTTNLKNKLKKYETNYNLCQSSLHDLGRALNQTKEELEIQRSQFNSLQINLEDLSNEKAVLKENNLQLFQNNQKLREEIEMAKNATLEKNETATASMNELDEIIQMMEGEMHNQTLKIQSQELLIANLTEQLENVVISPRLVSAEEVELEESSTSISPTAAAFVSDLTTIIYEKPGTNFTILEEQYLSEIKNLTFDLNQTRSMLNKSENFNNRLREQIVELEIEVENLKNDKKIQEDNLFTSSENSVVPNSVPVENSISTDQLEELARIKLENAKLKEERESLVMSNIMMSSYCNKTVAENSASFKSEIRELKTQIEELKKNQKDKIDQKHEQTLERPVIVSDDEEYLYYDDKYEK